MKIANAKTFGNQMYLTEADLTSMIAEMNLLENPSGGMDGMYLKNTESGVEWANIEAVPTSLEDMDSASYQMLIDVNEKVSGIESGATSVDSSTVEGWGYTKVTSAQVADWGYTKVTSANVSTIVTDIAYTKGQVDSTVSAINAKLTNVYTYKGSVNYYANLPSEGMNVGDVYNVANSNKANGIKAGDNVAWNGSKWDVLAGDVDLSEYAMISTVSSMIDDAVETKASVSDLAQVAFTGNYGDLSELPDLSEFSSHIDSSVIHVPTNGSSGQVLKMNENGVPVWDVDLTVGGSAVLPNYDPSKAGQILQVKANGTETEWVDKPIGDMTIDSFVNGNGVVKSAVYADSAVKVNGHTVSADVPSTAVFTDTIPGSATITLKANNTNIGSFSVNASENASVNIPAGTNTSYGVVKVETTISNTTNAVANSVVSATSSSLASAINAHAGNTNVHVPSTGTTGYFLKKTENGNTWAAVDIPTLTVDSEITSNGVNAVAGSAIYHAVEARAKIEDLSKVAFTGNYSDLIGTPNDTSINAHVINSAIHVPTGGTSGQVLKMTANGVPAWGTDLTVGGSAVLPNYDSSKAGKILQVKAGGTETEWVDKPIGNMTIDSFVNGNGVVNSATYATSAMNVNGFSVSTNVPSDAQFTDTIPGSATITLKANNTNIGSFSVNASENASVNIPAGTNTSYGVVKVETTISNTTNAVANSVVFAMSSSFASSIYTHVSTTNIHVPSTGTTGYYLKKTDNGTEWAAVNIQNISIDSSITSNGTNAVAGSVIYSSLEGKVDIEDLAQVAFTGNYSDLNGVPSTSEFQSHMVSSIIHVPTGGTYGQVLKVNESGVPVWGTDLTADGSAVLPTYGAGDANKILKVNGTGTATTWQMANIGDMTISSFVNGNGVVNSATYATSATKVNGHTVSTDVPSDAVFTDTVPGSATVTLKAGGTSIGSFNVNESSNTSVNIPIGNNTSYGVVKVETTVSNTSNAVANSVVSAINATMSAHIASTAIHGDMTVASFVNGAGVVKSATNATNATSATVVNGHTVSADVPSNAVFTDTTVKVSNGVISSMVAGTNVTLTSNGGVVTIAATGGGNVDNSITSNGANAVAGSAIYSGLEAKADIEDMAQVAFTGNYSDLNGVVSAVGSEVYAISAGSNVTLNNTNGTLYISATGGGNVTVDGTVTQNGTNAVAGSAVYNYVDAQIGNIATALSNI